MVSSFPVRLLLSIFLLSVVFSLQSPSPMRRRVLVWMCLERCGGNSSTINQSLQEISLHKDVLSAVAFEAYNLGPNSTLLLNNLTVVSPQIQQMGLESWAMVSSFPYPPDFLKWMRQVFADPQPFIESCILEAKKWNYTGFNIDWEPTTRSTPADATAYASFLTILTTSLNQQSIQVSVDVASWNSIWNFTLINQSSVNYILDMDTYSAGAKVFAKYLIKAVDTVDLNRLGVGLETTDPNTGKFYTDQQTSYRIKSAAAAGAQEIDFWDMPIPPTWWTFIEWFSSGGSSSHNMYSTTTKMKAKQR